jgi:hypothetical protein
MQLFTPEQAGEGRSHHTFKVQRALGKPAESHSNNLIKDKSGVPPKTTEQSTSHFQYGARNGKLAKTMFSHGNSTHVSTMFGKLVESEGSSPGINSKAEKRSFEIVDY